MQPDHSANVRDTATYGRGRTSLGEAIRRMAGSLTMAPAEPLTAVLETELPTVIDERVAGKRRRAKERVE